MSGHPADPPFRGGVNPHSPRRLTPPEPVPGGAWARARGAGCSLDGEQGSAPLGAGAALAPDDGYRLLLG